jgi:hypothetical protein
MGERTGSKKTEKGVGSDSGGAMMEIAAAYVSITTNVGFSITQENHQVCAALKSQCGIFEKVNGLVKGIIKVGETLVVHEDFLVG